MKRASKLFFVAMLTLAACVPVYAAALININTASQAQLDTLKGIGPTYAARIIAYRNTNGFFKSIEDIQDVKGIGLKTFAGIKDSITIDYIPPEPAPTPAPKPKVAAPAKILPAAVHGADALAEISQTQLAAAGETAGSFPLAASLVGLVGLAGLGALGVVLARRPTPKPIDTETTPSADEFDIE